MANSDARGKSQNTLVRETLSDGVVIPAHPLALNAS
jgi:hypothetical protein